jgi:signal peptidase I
LSRLAAGGLRTLCLSWLLVLAGLQVDAMIGWAIGWQPAVVVGRSMGPSIQPGDVVLADPAAIPKIRSGQIVLGRDPDRGGALLTHRVTAVDRDGCLVTKGDASSEPDRSPLCPADIVGVVRLVIPQAGRALLIVGHPSTGGALWVLGLALLAAGALVSPGSSSGGRAGPRSGSAVGHRRIADQLGGEAAWAGQGRRRHPTTSKPRSPSGWNANMSSTRATTVSPSCSKNPSCGTSSAVLTSWPGNSAT